MINLYKSYMANLQSVEPQDLQSVMLLTALWNPATGINTDNYYGKCPKISYTKAADKMGYANSADPDQTAPEAANCSGTTLFAIQLCVLNNCIKIKIKVKIVWNKVFKILGNLPYYHLEIMLF